MTVAFKNLSHINEIWLDDTQLPTKEMPTRPDIFVPNHNSFYPPE